MRNQVLIPAGDVDDDQLDALVQQIAAMKCADAEIEKQYVVTSDSPALLAALRALFGDSAVAAETKQKRNAERIQKRSKIVSDAWQGNGKKPEPTRGPHVRSIKVNGGGEMISRFELNKRLAEKSIAEGTVLHSPKYGETQLHAKAMIWLCRTLTR